MNEWQEQRNRDFAAYHIQQEKELREEIQAENRNPTSEEREEGTRHLETAKQYIRSIKDMTDKEEYRPTKPHVGPVTETPKPEFAEQAKDTRSYRGLFHPNTPNKVYSDGGFESLTDFLNCFSSGRSDPRFVTERAMTGITDAAGGMVIPTAFSQQIMDLSLRQEKIASLCKVYPMATRTLTVPAWDDLDLTSNLAGLQLEWLPESATGTKRTGALRGIKLEAKTGAIYADQPRSLSGAIH